MVHVEITSRKRAQAMDGEMSSLRITLGREPKSISVATLYRGPISHETNLVQMGSQGEEVNGTVESYGARLVERGYKQK